MDGYRECTERKDDGHERGSVLHELSAGRYHQGSVHKESNAPQKTGDTGRVLCPHRRASFTGHKSVRGR